MIRKPLLAPLLVLGIGACSDAQTAGPAREETNAATHLAFSEDYVAVNVDRNTRVGDIARLSSDRLRIDCSRGIDLCTASRRDDRFMDVTTYFGVDDRRYDSTPYEIEFGPGREDSR